MRPALAIVDDRFEAMARLIDEARACGFFVKGHPRTGCVVSRRLHDALDFSIALLDDTWKRFASESVGPTARVWTFPADRSPDAWSTNGAPQWVYYARNGRRT